MSDQTKVFANGIYFKEPSENAPDWVIGGISFKADEAIQFIKENTNDGGWVKTNIKRSQSGKTYIELDTWAPKQQNDQPQTQETPVAAEPAQSTSGDALPF